ncbi:MAG: rod shape-determining protein [Acidobacteria bacterium]|nr:MAG: rod shape-determining protein [Acidobacteriota bacterium]PYY20925.1 MAG: rod shape-determining protein [Acidobacteriota bacterium]
MGTLGLGQLGRRVLFPFGDSSTNSLILDLGSSNTRIYHPVRGLLLNEPSLVARNILTGETVAFGTDAKEILGRTSRFIEVVSPLRNGKVADLDATAAMLKFFLHRAQPRRLRNPGMIIAVPSSATPLERRAVVAAATRANASDVLLVEQTLLIAVGVGLPITTPTGSVIAAIGGGTTEVAVVSFGGLVYSRSMPVGGLDMDRAIADYLRSKHHVLIGDSTAEQIKLEMGSAAPLERGLHYGVTGRDLATGMPRDVSLTDVEIRDILAEALDRIGTAILNAIEHAPPELLGDIRNRGIVLAGGVSQLRNIEARFRKLTGLPVLVADDPFNNVLLGAAKLLRDPKMLARLSIREELTLKRAA